MGFTRSGGNIWLFVGLSIWKILRIFKIFIFERRKSFMRFKIIVALFLFFLFLQPAFSQSYIYFASWPIWADRSSTINRMDMDGKNISTIYRNSPYDYSRFSDIDFCSNHLFFGDWLYSHAEKQIQTIDTHALNLKTIVPLTSGIIERTTSIALNPALNKLYWMNMNNSIGCSSLDGQNIQSLVAAPAGKALDYDAVSDIIYWTEYDSTAGYIYMLDLNTMSKQTIISATTINPRAIAVDTINDRIYFSDNKSNSLKRCDIDGTNVVVIATGLQSVYDIELDIAGQVIYWTETNSDGVHDYTAIKKCQFDGTNCTTLYSKAERDDYVYGVTLDIPLENSSLLGLVVACPNELLIGGSARLKTYALYEHNHVVDISNQVAYGLNPSAYGIVDSNGLLHTFQNPTPQDLYITVSCNIGGTNYQQTKVIKLFSLSAVNVTGASIINYGASFSYKAKAVYDNGREIDITNTAVWSHLPSDYGSLTQTGVYTAGDINAPPVVNISAQYTDGVFTIIGTKEVQINIPRNVYVPDEFPTIQDALYKADIWDTIIVRDGIYTGQGNTNLTNNERSIRSEHGPQYTIIDCQNTSKAFQWIHTYGSPITVSGFTFINAYGSDSGAIRCIGDDITIENCIFRNNNAYGTSSNGVGAAVVFTSDGQNSFLKNCLIERNTAQNGAAISIYNWHGTIENCIIRDNNSIGIYTNNTFDTTISNSTIEANKKSGIVSQYSRLNIAGCLIQDNFESGIQIPSGNSGSTLNITGSGIYGNNDAGIKMLPGDNAIYLSDSEIIGNYSTSSGGGIYLSGTKGFLIKNCIIANNHTAKNGGGIALYFAIIRGFEEPSKIIHNCTIFGNIADANGGGMNLEKFVDTDIKNCIFWENDAATNIGDEINIGILGRIYGFVDRFTNTFSYNDIRGGRAQIHVEDVNIINWSIGNIDSEPLFADAANHDFHLKSAAGRWLPSAYCKLDSDKDAFFNLRDFTTFAASWRQQGEMIPADLDNNGSVDFIDMRLLADNYLTRYPRGKWVHDTVTSPCIDAGDPNSDWKSELWPHGKRINIGAYGGTQQASKSLSMAGNIADFDNDGFINIYDLWAFTNKWLVSEILIKEDMDSNGIVDFADFALFAENWLVKE
jgi:hypothetical protein